MSIVIGFARRIDSHLYRESLTSSIHLDRSGNCTVIELGNSSDGEEFIGFRKAYTDEVLMKIMKDYDFLSGKVFNDIKEASAVEEE